MFFTQNALNTLNRKTPLPDGQRSFSLDLVETWHAASLQSIVIQQLPKEMA